jgi:hypothetical protein
VLTLVTKVSDADGPGRRDTISISPSMTKPIQRRDDADQEGKLRVDEPVDRLLPELATGASTSGSTAR